MFLEKKNVIKQEIFPFNKKMYLRYLNHKKATKFAKKFNVSTTYAKVQGKRPETFITVRRNLKVKSMCFPAL